MTHDTNAIIVGGDEALYDWLRDRFGVDTSKVYIRDGLEMTVSRNEVLTLHLHIFVGADDLAAFPPTARQVAAK